MNSTRSFSPRRLAAHILEVLKQTLLSRLLSYCKKRVVEVGLTSGALAGEYPIGTNVNESRKTVGRLKVLMYKYLVKRIPYLALAQTDFLQIANRQSLQVIIESPQMTSDFKYVDWPIIYGRNSMSNYELAYNGSGSIKGLAVKSHPKNKWASRYVRYLNYLCRKYSIPVFVHQISELKFDAQVMAEVSNMNSANRAKAMIPFSMVTSIQFELAAWYSTNESLHAQIRSGEIVNDGFYSDVNNWSYRGIIGGYVNPSDASSPSLRFSVEKLFLHLDKALVTLSTLTRKTYYETSAYSFRITTND